MDRRDFRKVASDKVLTGALMKAERYSAQGQNVDRVQAKRAILQELGADLSVRAERMRLRTRDIHDERSAENNTVPTDVNLTRVISRSEIQTHQTKTIQDVSSSPSRIPVSQARQRRRENKERGQHRPPKSHISIHNYRPDYNWNRGGRVKELRIRCIARKFLFLWMKSVFGRVTLSKAKTHFNKRLVKKTFGVWHEMWWELRKEWRLQVRAECHHRYVLWSRVFLIWKEFVQRQRGKKVKFFTAQKHYVIHTERKVISCWMEYVQQKRGSNELKKRADNFRRTAQLRYVWREWQIQMALADERQEMNAIALQFWAYRIQAQHWLLWHEAYQRRQSERKKLVHADRHQNSVLVSRCLQAWIAYHRQRQKKMKYKDYAERVYQMVLKTRYLQQWQRHLELRQSLARHEDHMQDLAYRFKLRQCLQHWKLYVQMQREDQDKERIADNHHGYHLMTVGLSAFRLYVVQQRLKVMRETMAQQLRRRQLCRWVWRRWLTRCESNEELKMMPLTQTARKHHMMVVMRKCFQSLLLYSQWRQHRKSEYSRADAHYYLHIMPQCVFRMKVFVQMEKNYRENKEIAADFRRESLYVKFFTQWQRALQQSRENRMLERMAILHDEDTRIQNYFALWRSRTAERLEENEKAARAGEHYCVSLCLRHLRAWRRHVNDLKQRELDEVKAIRHHYLCVLKRCFSKWKSYHAHRKKKHCLTQRALAHLKLKLLRQSVLHWRIYIDQTRKVKVTAESRHKEKCDQHLRWAVCVWRENVKLQVAERQQESAACIHHNRYLLVKVLRTWHRFAAIHAYKKSETRHLVEEARVELEKSKLQMYFHRWCEARNSALVARLKWEQAVQHDHNNKMKDAFSRWRQYSALQIRQNLLQRQSQWFLNVRLTAKCFLLWKERMAEADVTKQKTGLALWHWSLNLLRKSVVAWYVYSQDRRRKKRRVAVALEGRRLRLLRDGAAQWMRVANDLAEMRGKFAAQQQAKSMFNTFQIVQKCALHWKYWAARRQELRGGPLPPHPQPSQHSQHPPTTNNSVTQIPQQYPPHLQTYPLPHIHPCPPSFLSAGAPLPDLKHTMSPSRPSHRLEIGQGDSSAPVTRRERARPRKPAFLIESLKRAGLYNSVYETSDQLDQNGSTTATKPDSKQHQPALPIQHQDQDCLHPRDSDTHRLAPTDPSHAVSRMSLPPQDEEEMTAPHLHLSNTSDTEFTPPVNFISPSCSTQRSQPSGNPLHYSSPKGEDGRSHKHHPSVRWKSNNDIISGNLDDHPSMKPSLLTPDDFLKKSDRSEFSARNGERVSFDSSQNKYYLDSSSDTPFPSVRHVQPKGNRKSEMYLDLSTVRSEVKVILSPADEIVQIRDKLKSFDGMKKRLRRLTKQHKQLSEWLKDQEVRGHSQDDEDVLSARNELQDLTQEMDDLKKTVERQRVSCQDLVGRAKDLVKQLETSV